MTAKISTPSNSQWRAEPHTRTRPPFLLLVCPHAHLRSSAPALSLVHVPPSPYNHDASTRLAPAMPVNALSFVTTEHHKAMSILPSPLRQLGMTRRIKTVTSRVSLFSQISVSTRFNTLSRIRKDLFSPLKIYPDHPCWYVTRNL
jgi:hypothetical protein